jgi:hypothetical protein
VLTVINSLEDIFMGIATRQKKLLDDKETFILWVELKSLDKVREHYSSRGIINPRTALPFSNMAIWTSAMRYVLANPEDAKPFYDNESGIDLSQDEWEKWLIKKAFQVFNGSKSRTIRWAKQNNLFDAHYEIFAEKFNLPERENA